MRDIKFRAWDGDGMYTQDTQGEEFIFDVYDDGLRLSVQEQYFETGSGEAYEMWRYVEKENAVFMQYTGLKDKNGVEIYEGDVLTLPERISRGDGFYDDELVMVEFEWAEFVVKNGNDKWLLSEVWAYFDSEVSGNIYENPELLEK